MSPKPPETNKVQNDQSGPEEKRPDTGSAGTSDSGTNNEEPLFEVDSMSSQAIDDNFLNNFENMMLVSSTEQEEKNEATTETIKINEEKATLNTAIPEHQKQVEDMITRSGLEVETAKVTSIESAGNIGLDYEKLDLESIDLSKLNIKFDEAADLKIGFNLDKINVNDMQINLDDVDINNIDFEKIKVDLSKIVSFDDTTREVKKRNLLLPSPVKGFYGWLVLNPFQELRNAFRKSYKEILQIARPGEAFQKQIEEGLIINADDIVEAHKKAEKDREEKAAQSVKAQKESNEDGTSVKFDHLAEQQLKEELGSDWNKIPELEKKEEKKKEEVQEKPKKTKITPALIMKKMYASASRTYHKSRSLYLRIFLISFTTKVIITLHAAIALVSIYLVGSKISLLMDLVGSSRPAIQAQKTEDIDDIAGKISDPHKRIPGPFVSVERIVGSFKDEKAPGGTRLFQISLYIETGTEELQKEITEKQEFFRDKIIKYLNSLDVKETEGTLGKERIKFGILSSINDELADSQAVGIYFSEFVMN